jgi:hypothetical protein
VAEDDETAQDRANAIQEALDQYTNSGPYDLGPDEPELDEWVCEDGCGRQIIRWGFYPDVNNTSRQSKSRKRMSSPGPDPEAKKPRIGRKMSISETVVNLDFPLDGSSDVETDVIGTNGSTSTR